MQRMRLMSMVVSATAMMAACSTDEVTVRGTAPIMPTTAQTVTGTAVFSGTATNVSLTVTVSAASAGTHGMHIHQNGACTMDAADAGGHWDGGAAAGDPTGHGLPDGATHHMGDLGNITIAAGGTGTLTFSNPDWTLGDDAMTDVVGHAVVFHATTDDGQMPSSGARQGCGVVALQ